MHELADLHAVEFAKIADGGNSGVPDAAAAAALTQHARGDTRGAVASMFADELFMVPETLIGDTRLPQWSAIVLDRVPDDVRATLRPNEVAKAARAKGIPFIDLNDPASAPEADAILGAVLTAGRSVMNRIIER
jgi:hypothetical protein